MSIISPDEATEAEIVEALKHLSTLPPSLDRERWIDRRLDQWLERRATPSPAS